MPIYEYSCGECDERFELLVRGSEDGSPACRKCGSEKVERVLSIPGIKSDGTRDLAMRAAKRRDQQQALDRMHERRRYEESHDRHGH